MDVGRFRTLARNWEALGDQDPLFGVLSDPSKHGGKWSAEEFVASGRAHIAELMRSLDDARAGFEPGTCLDFGCGVGRLTIPLADHFARTIGVDVAASMIESARSLVGLDDRVAFVVNRDPDLRQFSSASFDVVHSCLVLQHIPPDVSLRYVEEFFRISKPGGLVVFQAPAAIRSERDTAAAQAMPDDAFSARLTIETPPTSLVCNAYTSVKVIVGNQSPVRWRHDIPAGRHICLANHWLGEDGSVKIQDDGRAVLPLTIRPGEKIAMTLTVQAPSAPGTYLLEIDLVQEHVGWFGSRGSPTPRVRVDVLGSSSGSQKTRTGADCGSITSVSGVPSATLASRSLGTLARPPLLRRLLRRLRGGTPTFEMHVIPQADVERVILASGGALLRAIDDNAAGARWLSYTYICRRHP